MLQGGVSRFSDMNAMKPEVAAEVEEAMRKLYNRSDTAESCNEDLSLSQRVMHMFRRSVGQQPRTNTEQGSVASEGQE